MEAVKKTLVELGNQWNDDVPPTFMKLYEPLQAEQTKTYQGKVKADKALKYGSDPRHRVDVYSPVEPSAAPRPVVVFFHGGGLVAGDNDATPHIWANIGNYFTDHGCVTVLGTYRLALQGGHWPDGADDLAAALSWVQANIASYGGDPDKIVALGQSAGAHHLATSMFLGKLDPPSPEAKPVLKGAVLLSCPFTNDDSQAGRVVAMMDWYRTDNVFEVNGRWAPGAIFREQFFGTTAAAPRDKLPCEMLLQVGEWEADEILAGTWEFVSDYKKRFGKLPLLEVIKGHNHLSYVIGLGLDEPDLERFGRRILDFVHETTQ